MTDKLEHPRIAMVGSYVPRQCGIATFSHNLATAISSSMGLDATNASDGVSVVAMNDPNEAYAYGPEVMLQIAQHRREDYRNAADILNNSRVDVVNVQHEFGLFGGDAGSYLLDMLDRLRKPVVSTLHTVLSEPDELYRDVMQRLCARSSTVVVMADRAKRILTERYDVDPEAIRLIHHGVPDLPFAETEPFKVRFGLAARPLILTFGLLGPSKSIEVMLEALAKVVADHPSVAYIVLGATHPAIRRESGELYRLSLERRAVELGIQKNVFFHNRYVSDPDLAEYLQAADIYVTPYRNKEQITSGTLAYALASGRAIISTPYWHAQELLACGRGRLTEFEDAERLASNLRDLLENPEKRLEMRKNAYEFGRVMTWPRVANQYVDAFEKAKSTFADIAPSKIAERIANMRMSLPAVHVDHLLRMTDDTGMLQHSVYATPDRRHGYCTDDNARALIVSAMVWTLFKEEKMLAPLHVYLSFLHFAFQPDTGRFRNFMSYDRRWLEEDGSDDSQGRALWALGYLTSHAPNESTKQLATDLFRSAAGLVDSLEWPRSWSFAILGLHYYLRSHRDDKINLGRMATLADRINERFVENEAPEWPWFEDKVTYDNARLPQALIIAGANLKRNDLTQRGLTALQWLVNVQTADNGHLSIIGNDGWLAQSGDCARYDQQALEPAALIGACKAAYRASNDDKWLLDMRRCFEWYVGRNDLGVSMIDFKSRGCFDGLTADGVNENQGAESVLSWLLSLLSMHEMQTGDAPELG